MFLSKLVVNIGEDPTRYRPAREWLRNLYRVHQRLWMAFPNKPEPATEGSDYPFFPDRLAHVLSLDTHLLFRIETSRPPMILVQSATGPNWQRAFWNAEYLLHREHPPRVKEYELPGFNCDQRLGFRLLANTTKRLRKDSRNSLCEPVPEKWIGKRVPVPSEDLEKWLIRRAEPAGFRLEAPIVIQAGYVYFNKSRDAGKGQRLRSVRYEGVLKVTEPERFRETLNRGIGPAKAFGFGLLSVAPVAQA